MAVSLARGPSVLAIKVRNLANFISQRTQPHPFLSNHIILSLQIQFIVDAKHNIIVKSEILTSCLGGGIVKQ